MRLKEDANPVKVQKQSNMDGKRELPVRLKEDTNPVKAQKQSKEVKLSKAAKELKVPPQKKEKIANAPAEPIDPNHMFKHGFLDTVYKEKPSKHVVTRFPPEPNGFLHIGKYLRFRV